MNTSSLTKAALTPSARENRSRFEGLLRDFVECPTVSVDPTKKAAIADGVKLAEKTIRDFSGTPSVPESGGNLIVSAAGGSDPSRPPVTIYTPLDVQPASRETEPWETDPFV